jgi:hypothetical protein
LPRTGGYLREAAGAEPQAEQLFDHFAGFAQCQPLVVDKTGSDRLRSGTDLSSCRAGRAAGFERVARLDGPALRALPAVRHEFNRLNLPGRKLFDVLLDRALLPDVGAFAMRARFELCFYAAVDLGRHCAGLAFVPLLSARLRWVLGPLLLLAAERSRLAFALALTRLKLLAQVLVGFLELLDLPAKLTDRLLLIENDLGQAFLAQILQRAMLILLCHHTDRKQKAVQLR